MGPRALAAAALTLTTAAALHAPAPVDARPSVKKAISSPVAFEGASVFGLVHELGAGTFHARLDWSSIAFVRPDDARDPADPDYEWPDELDYAIRNMRGPGRRVAVTVVGAPFWSNEARGPNRLPTFARDLEDFLTAASLRYPGVKVWRYLEQANVVGVVAPLDRPADPAAPLGRVQAAQVRRLAQLQDRAYGALKAADRRDLVVGGNIAATGDIAPQRFLEAYTVREGRAPRMDLLGYDPFVAREPVAPFTPLGGGVADLLELDRLHAWVRAATGRRTRLFLRYGVPTDHRTAAYGDLVLSREDQARWLREAAAIALADPQVEVFGWDALFDPPPSPDRLEVTTGLIDATGLRKPAYDAFRDG